MHITSCQLCEGRAIRARQLKQLMKLNRITNARIKNVSLAFAKLVVIRRYGLLIVNFKFKNMETLSSQKEVIANKEHRCNFCCEKIRKDEKYITSTHKYDGQVYDWKTHIHCNNIADRLRMYDHCQEYDCGVTEEYFQTEINEVHDDLLIAMIPVESIKDCSDIIQQLRCVRFKDKLNYVIRYYDNRDKLSGSNAV